MSGRRASALRPNTAQGGVFVPADQALIPTGDDVLALDGAPAEGLTVSDPQNFLVEDERRAYEHFVGLLLDSKIQGELKNEYLYLGSSLNGEIHTDNGRYIEFSLSDTFIAFTLRGPDGSGGDGSYETDGEKLEAGQIREVFNRLQLESLMRDTWSSVTDISSGHGVAYRPLDLAREGNQHVVSLPVETKHGDWTIEVRSCPGDESFRYKVVDNERGITLTSNMADAVLTDLAEHAGIEIGPGAVIQAMTTAAAEVRRSPTYASVLNQGESLLGSLA